ncbi:acyl-CoA dehydrogenase family protein [Paraburkholderia sediminicola]|uniref:acyl-CoA dehydrogenase family protein n=1 Tax=Paraburkholderia sediminicola TaxID=458836 RepID=UPI000FF5077C
MNDLAELGLYDLGHARGNGGVAELLIAMEELGRASCPADLLSGVVLRESSQIEEEWFRQIAASSMKAACMFIEAGVLVEREGTLTGEIAVAEILPGTTHMVLVIAPDALCIVPIAQTGVRLASQSIFGHLPAVSISLTSAEMVRRASLTPVNLASIQSLFRAAACARALGAGRQALDLVVAYTKERKQFSRQIGTFQAVQHKLANCLIDMEGIGELLAHGARLRDQGDEQWAFFLDAAFAYAAEVLPKRVLDIQHTFGAIGYAEEHDMPNHFRRVHWDMLAVGGRASAQQAVHDRIVTMQGMPDRPLDVSADQFRCEVREWLSENWTEQDRVRSQSDPFHLRDRNPEFARRVGAKGWAALTWPTEFGGLARPVTHQLVLAEEMEKAEAPRFGAPIHAAAIMAFGSEKQRTEHLERIRCGDGIYGIAYSEPDSGSDLASVRTSATQRADGWVINGQKIWMTTYWGGHMWVLARTDPEASPRHAGLSLFLMRTDTPGVTIVPADTMYGGKFANVFFDDVRLPEDALLGGVNEAWRILNLALAVERAVIGGAIVGRILHSFAELVNFTRKTSNDMGQEALIGSFGVRLAIAQALAERSARAVDEGKAGLVEAAICKVFCSELMEDFFEQALQCGGATWALSEDSPGAVCSGRFEQRLRHSLMHVISGGTNDIQRNLIAQRALGLPKG